ncbi:uncharacterized protein LOC110598274 isoform X3 [Ictidomys tridecemlineatus]
MEWRKEKEGKGEQPPEVELLARLEGRSSLKEIEPNLFDEDSPVHENEAQKLTGKERGPKPRLRSCKFHFIQTGG